MKAGPHFSVSVAPLRRKDFENTKRNHLINWILNDWTFNFVDCHSNLHLEWSISFCCFYTCTAVYETNMKTMRLKSVKLGTKSENVKWNGDPRWSTVIHGDPRWFTNAKQMKIELPSAGTSCVNIGRQIRAGKKNVWIYNIGLETKSCRIS